MQNWLPITRLAWLPTTTVMTLGQFSILRSDFHIPPKSPLLRSADVYSLVCIRIATLDQSSSPRKKFWTKSAAAVDHLQA